MLVLTRKMGEAIAIGDDIKIVVMQVKGKQVRLGIKAPAETTVHREEVWKRILDENRRASTISGAELEAWSKILGPKALDESKPSFKARDKSKIS